jgi:hypothetical protein
MVVSDLEDSVTTNRRSTLLSWKILPALTAVGLLAIAYEHARPEQLMVDTAKTFVASLRP